jgi:hypothetical protein
MGDRSGSKLKGGRSGMNFGLLKIFKKEMKDF